MAERRKGSRTTATIVLQRRLLQRRPPEDRASERSPRVQDNDEERAVREQASQFVNADRRVRAARTAGIVEGER